MIKKLKRQIIAGGMALVLVMLLGILGSIYFTTRRNIEQDSRELLELALHYEMPEHIDGPETERRNVRLPYFTVTMTNGIISQIWGNYVSLDDPDLILNIVNDCLSRKEPEGKMENYHLRFRVVQDRGRTTIAFADMSQEESTLRQMSVTLLVIGLAALACFTVLIVLFARFTVRPVEETLQKQQQFLSDASHELKTPLTVILSNADLLQAETEGASRDWTENIVSEGKQMRQLIEQMLTLARMDRRTEGEDRETINYSELLLDEILRFEPVAFEEGRTLVYDIAENISVIGRAQELHQIMGILLDNAIKYSPENSEIRIGMSAEGKKAWLWVKNDNQGEPLSEEKQRHLFDRFYRGDESRGEVEGFGLGLSIASSYAAEMKGSLKVKSDASGTCFTLELPLGKEKKNG